MSESERIPRPRLKSRYQIELVSLVTGRSIEAIRQYMYRRDLPYTTEGYAAYMGEVLKKRFVSELIGED